MHENTNLAREQRNFPATEKLLISGFYTVGYINYILIRDISHASFNIAESSLKQECCFSNRIPSRFAYSHCYVEKEEEAPSGFESHSGLFDPHAAGKQSESEGQFLHFQ